MESVRHCDFKGRLQAVVADARSGPLTIALHAGGEINDANIVLCHGQTRQVWRVGTGGGRTRVDSWNLVSVISSIVSEGVLPDNILTCYADAISARTGWVVLTVTSGRATSARAATEAP